MKLKAIAVLAVLSGGLLAGYAMAESITVSSSTVTTIVGGNSGRKVLCLQNTTTNPVYFSKFTSSATVTGGMIMVSSTSVPQPICIDGYAGPVYGLAGAGATGTVKYFETSR